MASPPLKLGATDQPCVTTRGLAHGTFFFIAGRNSATMFVADDGALLAPLAPSYLWGRPAIKVWWWLWAIPVVTVTWCLQERDLRVSAFGGYAAT